MATIIRPATPADAASIVAMNLALAWETEHKRLDPAVLARGVAKCLADPAKGFYLVAELDGAVAGQVLVTTEWSDWRDGTFWWIQSVYVVESARRRGLFTRLYRHLERLARAQGGVIGFRLYVEHDNAAGQSTYARLGFEAEPYRMLARPLEPSLESEGGERLQLD